MRLHFLHGAGGYDEDRLLARGLAATLGRDLNYTRLPDEDMSLAAWGAIVRDVLGEAALRDLVVAHSFGASVLLRVLAADDIHLPAGAVLLAMPNWGPDGWDVADYAVEGEGGPLSRTPLTLHHCRDDEVVPWQHLDLNAAALPSAKVRLHPTGGHQFTGRIRELAADLR